MLIRKLEVGDTIVCKGTKATVGEIIYQDAFIPASGVGSYIEIEFKDIKGNYRNWKSEVDGGDIDYKDISAKRKAMNGYLKSFYDINTGSFLVPFPRITENMIEEIISLLKNGFVMTCNTKNSILYYEICEVGVGCDSYGEISKCKEEYSEYLSRYSNKYFTEIPLNMFNFLNSTMVDNLLFKYSYKIFSKEGYSIALTCSEDSLKFVEIFNK